MAPNRPSGTPTERRRNQKEPATDHEEEPEAGEHGEDDPYAARVLLPLTARLTAKRKSESEEAMATT
jgi:hypothetical protein